MFFNQTISVCIVTHRRLNTIEEVCKAWLREPITELILCDCSVEGALLGTEDSRFTQVRFSKDMGNRTRHAIALLSCGDYVIQADDDVMPAAGFTADLINGLEQTKADIVGVIGRVFHNATYKDGGFYAANLIAEPVETSFVGVVYCSQRHVLAFDMREMETPINDLYWCIGAMPYAVKYVVPTKKYSNLKTSGDADCLFHSEAASKVRQAYYEKHYKKGLLKDANGIVG